MYEFTPFPCTGAGDAAFLADLSSPMCEWELGVAIALPVAAVDRQYIAAQRTARQRLLAVLGLV